MSRFTNMSALESLIHALSQAGGTDLHLSPGEPPRARVQGRLQALGDVESPRTAWEEVLRRTAPAAAWERLEESGEAEWCADFGASGRHRVHLFRERQGMAANLRPIPSTPLSLEYLEAPASICGLAKLQRGLVILAGQGSSGKTTTTAAIVEAINQTRANHIVTIERPLEIIFTSKMSLIHQREVGVHTKSFAQGVHAALREDADVVAIGDASEPETTAAALEAASRGCLVLAILHAPTVAEAIDRVIEAFPPAAQANARSRLAATLQGIVAQLLLPRKDSRQLVAASEVLLSTPTVASLIRDGKTQQLQATMQTNGRVGMSTLNDSLVRLASRGLVEPQEAIAVAFDREGLLRGLQTAGVRLESSPAAPVPA